MSWLAAARIRLALIRRVLGVLWIAVFGYVPEIEHAPGMLDIPVPPCPGCNRCQP